MSSSYTVVNEKWTIDKLLAYGACGYDTAMLVFDGRYSDGIVVAIGRPSFLALLQDQMRGGDIEWERTRYEILEAPYFPGAVGSTMKEAMASLNAKLAALSAEETRAMPEFIRLMQLMSSNGKPVYLSRKIAPRSDIKYMTMAAFLKTYGPE